MSRLGFERWQISAGWTAEKGVASVTRVIPDPHKDIGLNILSQFHYGPEIEIATFQTLADALQSITAK